MRNFDPDTEDGSFWVDSDFSSQAFDNFAPTNSPEFTLLGTIIVSTQPGDYDGDGSVTVADYGVWRSQFGLQVSSAGQGADGNQNGTVDAADYVLWRLNLTSAPGASVVPERAALPEPESLSYAIVLTVGVLVIVDGRTNLKRSSIENDSVHFIASAARFPAISIGTQVPLEKLC